MAMQKNIAKRNEILHNAFELISEFGYCKVFLRDIAERSDISKSLLQHYFSKKSDIIESVLEEMLNSSFRYMEEKGYLSEGIHLKLSIYTSLFWGAISKYEKWNKFIIYIISERELLDMWINIVYKWLCSLEENSGSSLSNNKLKVATSFAIAGGMELYLFKDEMNIDISYICEQITTSFMKILGSKDINIEDTLNKTRLFLKQIDLLEFGTYCENEIEWFVL